MPPVPPQILVVDDEEAVSGLLCDFLTLRKFSHEAVNSGEAAVAFLEQQQVALVLCDLRMPGLAGAPLIRRIQEISPAAHVVIMTGGMPDDEDLLAALDAGAVSLLHKPFKLEEVQSLCNRFVSQAA